LTISHHNNNWSYITHSGSGNLGIESVNDIILRNTSGEVYVDCNEDGAVELYWGGTSPGKRFETTASGVTVTGGITAAGLTNTSGQNADALIVNRTDGLQLFGVNWNVDANEVSFAGNTKNYVFKNGSSSAETCRITSGGNLKLPDSAKIELGGVQTGSGDLQIFHSGGYSKVEDSSTAGLILRNTSGADVFIQSDDDVIIGNYTNSSEYYIRAIEGAAVELYHNAIKKFETHGDGIHVTGDVSITGHYLADNNEMLKMGNGANLTIYHTGSDARIKNITGTLCIDTQVANGEIRFTSDNVNDNMIRAVRDAQVELFYDGTKVYNTGPFANSVTNGMLSGNSVLSLNTDEDGSGSAWFLRGSYNSTTVGGGTDAVWIYEDGDIYNVNGTFSQSSDSKLKENIIDAPSQWNDLKALKVRKFNFKSSTGLSTHTQIGMVAQEVETTCPGLITERVDLQKTENSDGTWTETDTGEKTKSIKLTVLYMKAVKALQEAMTRIETLETKVATLESA
jgi:hypothetical protein